MGCAERAQGGAVTESERRERLATIPGETALAASLCVGLSQILIGLPGGLIWLNPGMSGGLERDQPKQATYWRDSNKHSRGSKFEKAAIVKIGIPAPAPPRGARRSYAERWGDQRFGCE